MDLTVVPTISPEATKPLPEKAPKPIQPKDSHITVISFAIFIILAIGTVAFFYYQNQQLKQILAGLSAPSPTPIEVTDPLANWQQYKSDDHGYQFKIPKEWNKIAPIELLPPKVVFQSTDGLYRFTLDIQDNKNKVTGKSYKSLDEFIGLPYTVKAITIDNQGARQPLPRAGMENFDKAYLFSPDEKSIFSLELLVGDGTMTDHRVSVESLRIGSAIFDQIVSTFKFTVLPIATPPESTAVESTKSSSAKVCTMDVKVCPDGSAVGRTEPNCEFAPCPSAQ